MCNVPAGQAPFLRQLATCLLFLLLALASSTSSAQQMGKRVGIVVGNNEYKTSPLSNPRNDATSMTHFLRANGFDVSEFLNLQTRQIPDLSEVVRRKVDSDTTLVVFYAGHGMQVEGRNYLPSPDASLQSLSLLKAGSIALDDLLATIQSAKPRASVVILDACRDNPFTASPAAKESLKGLARAVAPPGTVIFYATRPGSTASDGSGVNGLFTEHLLREAKDTNIPLELVFRRVSNSVYKASRGEQEPWVEGVIREEIILAASPTASPLSGPVALATSVSPPPTRPAVTIDVASSGSAPAALGSSAASEPRQPMDASSAPDATPSLLPTLAAIAHVPPTPMHKSQALLALRKLDLSNEQIPTRFICRDDLCEPYSEAFRHMRSARSLPTLPVGQGVMRLCEFDLVEGKCKSDFLSHGTGVSPVALFAKMFGTSVNTRQLVLSDVQNSNGGGLVFGTEPQISIVRSRLGVSNDIGCRTGTGRLELMPDRVELELAQNLCVQTTPPVPWQYKLSMEVLLFDLTSMQALVRWRQRGVSVGLYMSSEGLARVTLE